MKRVGSKLYVHVSALDELSQGLRRRVDVSAARVPKGWDLVRLNLSGREVMFGWTESWETEAHPQLLVSRLVVPGKPVKTTDYRKRGSRPVYHRKESMVGADHPQRAEFAALTAAEAQAGLLGRKDIGGNKAWARALNTAGYVVDGHKLVKVGKGRGARGGAGRAAPKSGRGRGDQAGTVKALAAHFLASPQGHEVAACATAEGSLGQCQDASILFAQWLEAQGTPNVRVLRLRGCLRDPSAQAHGLWRPCPMEDWLHYVVQLGDTVWDWTARQLASDAPWPHVFHEEQLHQEWERIRRVPPRRWRTWAASVRRSGREEPSPEDRSGRAALIGPVPELLTRTRTAVVLALVTGSSFARLHDPLTGADCVVRLRERSKTSQIAGTFVVDQGTGTATINVYVGPAVSLKMVRTLSRANIEAWYDAHVAGIIRHELTHFAQFHRWRAIEKAHGYERLHPRYRRNRKKIRQGTWIPVDELRGLVGGEHARSTNAACTYYRSWTEYHAFLFEHAMRFRDLVAADGLEGPDVLAAFRRFVGATGDVLGTWDQAAWMLHFAPSQFFLALRGKPRRWRRAVKQLWAAVEE